MKVPVQLQANDNMNCLRPMRRICLSIRASKCRHVGRLARMEVTTMTDALRTRLEGGVLKLTMNLQDKRNALNAEMMQGEHRSLNKVLATLAKATPGPPPP
jgi:hypothetical protein